MPTFDSTTRSQALNRPIILYTIASAGATYNLTTNGTDVVVADVTFHSLTISHDDEIISQDNSGDEVVIHLPITHEIVQRYAASGIPDQGIIISIFELQQSVGVPILAWTGPAQSLSVDGALAALRVPNTTNDATRIKLPVVAAQPICNHTLFDSQCSPNPGAVGGGPIRSAFQYSTSTLTLISTDGLTLTFNNIAGLPDHFLDFGTISATILDGSFNGEVQTRSIITHIGVVVTIDVPFVATFNQLNSSVITLEAGCAHDKLTCRDKFNNIFNFGGHPEMISVNQWNPIGLGLQVT